jgi:hypothetical protein
VELNRVLVLLEGISWILLLRRGSSLRSLHCFISVLIVVLCYLWLLRHSSVKRTVLVFLPLLIFQGGHDCFPLAFFIPFCLMLVATGVFVAGSGSFKKTPITTDPGEQTQVLGVVWSSLSSYFKTGPKGYEAGL